MPFIYRRLNSEARHVRYVSLTPGDPGGPIGLVLIHAPLQVAETSSTASTENNMGTDETEEEDIQALSTKQASTPPHTVSLPDSQYQFDGPPRFTGTYSALSYCWGDRATKHEIILRYLDDSGPGAVFAVSENLHSFLRSYRQRPRQENETEWLWIDQLCIDQSNDPEKHGQISLMGDIYSQAARVIVWLGPAFEQSDRLMKVLKSGIGVPFMRLLACHAYRQPQRGVYDLTIRELKKSALDTLDPCIKALKILLTLTYWSRVWICQEFLLAKDGVIYLGNSSLPMKAFCRQLRYLETIRALDPPSARGWMQCKKLITAPLIYKKHMWTWQRLLQLMKGGECERYEDRICGLLQRPKEHRVQISVPAFSESREQFLMNIVRQLMVEYLDDATPKSEWSMLYDTSHNALAARRLLHLKPQVGKFAVLKMVSSEFSELMRGRTVLTRKPSRWAVLFEALIAQTLIAPLDGLMAEPVPVEEVAGS